MVSPSDILATTYGQPTPPKITEDNVAVSSILFVIAMVAVMGSASIIFHVMGCKERTSRRLVFILSTIMAAASALSYLSIFSRYDMGYNCEILNPRVPLSDGLKLDCRQTFGTQYLDLFITSTIVIIQLSLVAGLNGATTFIGVVSNIFMFASGAVAADRYRSSLDLRITWTVITSIFFALVFSQIGLNSIKAAKSRGTGYQKPFTGLVTYALIFLGVQFNIFMIGHVWGAISTNTEMLSFLVADLLFKPVFGFWLLRSYQQIPEFQFEVSGYWSHGITSDRHTLLSQDDE
ncbi:hypothetical protein NLG97_g1910 [Lecanicillium saksenae]|uniref:Uncharacterized protein n=1 Tax=Lecanicillium saksenae TaxID=468837 RepID=A0ACC1R549_9HYPO|nr:hypothetical protein NLG97_g1910 [Lecanicillium saksenae]